VSLIYQSLQQATAGGATGEAFRPAMQQRRSQGRDMSKRVVFLLLILSVFCMTGYGLVVWAQKEVRLWLPIEQTARVIEGPGTVEIIPWEEESPPTALTELETLTASLDARDEALPVQKTLPAPEPNTGQQLQPSKELEELFQRRARRNRVVMELDRQLASAWIRDDLQAMSPLLQQLLREAGQDSVLYRKWAGTVALKRGDHAEAEEMFVNLTRDHRADATVRVNLVLALLGQQKNEAARQTWKRLQEDFPQDQKIRDLGKIIPEEVKRRPEMNASTPS
jgi:hypothetical protein